MAKAILIPIGIVISSITIGLLITGLFATNFMLAENEVAPVATIEADEISEESYVLSIPKHAIVAPIVLDVPGDNQVVYFKSLKQGVAHYKGTALPGESGNSFIFGHSSSSTQIGGLYKDIFRNLNELKLGDEIIVSLGTKQYMYVVNRVTEVDPHDFSVTLPTPTPTLTLMTCWPPGTVSKRLVIKAALL